MNFIHRWARCAPALVAAFAVSTAPALAQSRPAPTEIDGHVVDAQTGLPLAGAVVSIVGQPISTVSDKNGNFRILGLLPRTYTLSATRTGYQPVNTDSFGVLSGVAAGITLSLQAAPTASRLTTIGQSSTTAVAALQKASTISRSLDPEEVGVERLAPVVHLDLHIGTPVPDPLGDPPGVGGPGPLTLDDGDEVVLLGHQPGEEVARRLGQ